jgi:hypothetical protein
MRGHAALKSVPFLGSLRELDPICRKPKPGLFVELADRLRSISTRWRPLGPDTKIPDRPEAHPLTPIRTCMAWNKGSS